MDTPQRKTSGKKLAQQRVYRQTERGKALGRKARSVYKKRQAARDTPRWRYTQHKSNAQARGIPFLLTFDEWWELWEPHWANRGLCSQCPVMSRHGDLGPYE